ncbi:MAG: lipid-binding SYLF domain-containing protein [Pseudomonadota bacterium]
MTRACVRLVLSLLFALGIAVPAASAGVEQEGLVDKARVTVQEFGQDQEVGPTVKKLMKSAKAVVVFPAILKGAFFVGAEGGSGVLLAKGEGGKWSYPAFYTLGGASFGLQIGGQSSEVMLLIMTSKGINSVINNQVKLGGDISVAVGPVGIGAEASTTTALGADIYSFSRNAGAYFGASLAGAVVHPRRSWNHTYYGSTSASPTAIVLDGKYFNAQANPLREALTNLK